ncbi:MAG: tetratricopeptide repeat protein [Symploca sp. SIO2E9]|nr:tetratricopeptide repeat protein [Symploca sp. SIO2E9]
MDQNDWVLAQKAETLRLSGAYRQAINIFKELRSKKKYEDNPWINAHLGTIYCQLMNYELAAALLLDVTEKHQNYLWAHAQLGEIYRLWAIVENRKEEYVDESIASFTTAINGQPEQSNYAWALAHLGATYRLKMTGNIDQLIKNQIDQESKQEALKCLNRAIELIPTYTWAWGMRATVYRLAQEYENSLWDLAVETVISQETEVLQNSSSPISGLDSRRSNLHEHAMLAFYLTKTNKKDQQEEQKDKNYSRALAYTQQALILNPGDHIAQLMLIVIEANKTKEKRDGSLSEQDIENIKKELDKFFLDGDPVIFNKCRNLLRHLVAVGRVSKNKLKNIRDRAGTGSILAEFVLVEDLIDESDADVSEEPEKWLWKNFAVTQACSSVMTLLSDLSSILKEDTSLGKTKPYRDLSLAINVFDSLERLYQTPALSEGERSTTLESWNKEPLLETVKKERQKKSNKEELKKKLASLSSIRTSL